MNFSIKERNSKKQLGGGEKILTVKSIQWHVSKMVVTNPRSKTCHSRNYQYEESKRGMSIFLQIMSPDMPCPESLYPTLKSWKINILASWKF